MYVHVLSFGYRKPNRHMNVFWREADCCWWECSGMIQDQGNRESDGGHIKFNLQPLRSRGALSCCVKLLLALRFRAAVLLQFHSINEMWKRQSLQEMAWMNIDLWGWEVRILIPIVEWINIRLIHTQAVWTMSCRTFRFSCPKKCTKCLQKI